MQFQVGLFQRWLGLEGVMLGPIHGAVLGPSTGIKGLGDVILSSLDKT